MYAILITAHRYQYFYGQIIPYKWLRYLPLYRFSEIWFILFVYLHIFRLQQTFRLTVSGGRLYWGLRNAASVAKLAVFCRYSLTSVHFIQPVESIFPEIKHNNIMLCLDMRSSSELFWVDISYIQQTHILCGALTGAGKNVYLTKIANTYSCRTVFKMLTITLVAHPYMGVSSGV